MSPSLHEKAALFDAMLADLAHQGGVPHLRRVGFTNSGGAQVNSTTGEVRVEQEALMRLSASTWRVIVAHEVGHARVAKANRHGVAPTSQDWKLWTLSLLLAGLVALGNSVSPALALGAGALLGVVGFGVALWRLEGPREYFEHEVRADAFAVWCNGGMPAWLRAVREFETKIAQPGDWQIRIRERALRELEQGQKLEQVALTPELPFPELQTLKELAPRHALRRWLTRALSRRPAALSAAR